MPVVFGYAGQYMVFRQLHVSGYATVFYPDILMLFREFYPYVGVLREQICAGFYAFVHYLPLVVHEVLYPASRRYEFPACAVMVEFASGQRHYGYGQSVYIFVGNLGVFAQSFAEVRIKVVKHPFAVFVIAFVPQDRYSLVAQQPDAYVHEEEITFGQFVELLYAWFLQHEGQSVGRIPVGNEHAVPCGEGGIYPESVAHHVGMGDRGKFFCGSDIYVSACHECMYGVGGFFHYLLIQWYLQRQQVLSQLLSSFPTEYRYGGQYLARRGIGRQPSAFPAGM